MMKLFACSLRIALKKMFAYPNEIIMIFFHSLFELLSTILFWVVLFDNVESLDTTNLSYICWQWSGCYLQLLKKCFSD
ncbi:MAG: hypothetical protein E7K74_03560 [Finegoldia magna]|nr:hypothetical protein [Finegoldia magna]